MRGFYTANQFQMGTWGEGVKKSENLADVIKGRSPSCVKVLNRELEEAAPLLMRISFIDPLAGYLPLLVQPPR